MEVDEQQFQVEIHDLRMKAKERYKNVVELRRRLCEDFEYEQESERESETSGEDEDDIFFELCKLETIQQVDESRIT